MLADANKVWLRLQSIYSYHLQNQARRSEVYVAFSRLELSAVLSFGLVISAIDSLQDGFSAN